MPNTAAPAEQSAASSALPASTRPTTLLTPAVTRVIAWHHQRLSAHHGRIVAASTHKVERA